LGDSIAQVAARNLPIPIEYIGTNDTLQKVANLLNCYKVRIDASIL
jgi:transketolase